VDALPPLVGTQVADLSLVELRDLDALALPVVTRRKLERCVDTLKAHAAKEL
jgi:hypothetical protein